MILSCVRISSIISAEVFVPSVTQLTFLPTAEVQLTKVVPDTCEIVLTSFQSLYFQLILTSPIWGLSRSAELVT